MDELLSHSPSIEQCMNVSVIALYNLTRNLNEDFHQSGDRSSIPPLLISLIPHLTTECAKICSINCLAHIYHTEEIENEMLTSRLKYLVKSVAHLFDLLGRAMCSSDPNTEFRYNFMRENQMAFFTATELVDAITKWSLNCVISQMIALNKTLFAKIIQFYMECRTPREKESASCALATLSMAPELNRVIRENVALCQCFQNDILKMESEKMRKNLIKIKCHICVNTSCLASITSHSYNVILICINNE